MESSGTLEKKKEIAKFQNQQSESVNLTKFDDFKPYIESLLASRAVPEYVKNAETAFMMMEYGKARGFTPIDSLHFITPVNGVMSTNAKGVGWLLKENKLVFREKYRACFIYSYRDKECISQRILQPDEVAYALDIKPEEWAQFDNAKKERISTYRDRVTTLEYGFKDGNNVFIKEGEHSYYWSDAVASGLSNKDTYIKYTADMMMHRCKVGLSKVLGILSGSETEELAIVKNVDYTVIDSQPLIIN